MKRFAAIALVFIMCVGMLTGCGSYKTDENTIFVLKHGKIVTTDVEEFDEDTYAKSDLEDYVKETIDNYTADNGKNTVKLKKISVKDGKATLTLEYKSMEDFSFFNGIELFTGSMAEALAAGYKFDTQFVSVKKGSVEDKIDASEFMDDDKLKVAIVKENTCVNVPGTILYVSTENVALKDKNTVSIQNGQNLLTELESTESQGVTETIDGTEVESTEEDMSVDEDEMLTGTEETTEKKFDFGNETVKNPTASEFSNVYTYVIYK